MGLVQRQGIKYSIVNWVGVLIGAYSSLFIYPRALEEFGLLRFILDTAALLLPLISLGISSVSIRFFPQFEDKERGHHGYLGVLMLWGLAGYLIFGGLALLLWQPISAFYAERSILFAGRLWLLFPVSLLMLVNGVLNQYALNFKRIVVPSLLMDFSQKLALPLLVIAYWQRLLPLDAMLSGIVVYMALVTVGFVIYIRHLGAWYWRPDRAFFRKMFGPMRKYAVFGLVGGLGFLLISKLDTWSVGTFVGLKSNGVYAIASFIANIMEVPSRGLLNISIPLIVKHWHEKNTAEIASLYQKVSINLFIFGLLLFGAFWISVGPFYKIVANGQMLETGKIVILLLGIGKLVDMATGLNNYILNYSEHFRYSYWQIGLPALVGVFASIALVPSMGMTGAAIATLISTMFYNGISLWLNWHFFRMQPFSFQSLIALSLAIVILCHRLAVADARQPVGGDPAEVWCFLRAIPRQRASTSGLARFECAVAWVFKAYRLNVPTNRANAPKVFDKPHYCCLTLLEKLSTLVLHQKH